MGDEVEVSGLVRGEGQAGGAARAAWAPIAATWRSMRAWQRVGADRRAWLAIWAALAAVAAEGAVLAWLVGGQLWDWMSAGLSAGISY